MAIERLIDVEVLGRSKLAFDEHACRRMRERHVTEEEVIAALQSPDATALPADAGRKRVRKALAGRAVDVVFEEEPTRIVVITVTAGTKK